MGLAAVLQQNAANSVGIEVQGGVQIRQRHVRRRTAGAEELDKGIPDGLDHQRLQVGAVLRPEQPEDQGMVLHSGGQKQLHSLLRPLCLMAEEGGLLYCLLETPLDHIQNVLKVVVEGLAGDAAGLHQTGDRDFIYIAAAGQLSKGAGDPLFHVDRHSSILNQQNGSAVGDPLGVEEAPGGGGLIGHAYGDDGYGDAGDLEDLPDLLQ